VRSTRGQKAYLTSCQPSALEHPCSSDYHFDRAKVQSVINCMLLLYYFPITHRDPDAPRHSQQQGRFTCSCRSRTVTPGLRVIIFSIFSSVVIYYFLCFIFSHCPIPYKYSDSFHMNHLKFSYGYYIKIMMFIGI